MPATHPSGSGLAPTATAARTTSDPSTVSAAASATHCSCWRSVPPALRKRTTSDPAPTTTARLVTRSELVDGQQRTPSPVRSNGFSGVRDPGSKDRGASTITRRLTTGTTTAARAHHRQRGEGSDPVGVSSRTKPSRARAGTMMAGRYRLTSAAAGTAPGLASSP
jgi:hypothetical protein